MIQISLMRGMTTGLVALLLLTGCAAIAASTAETPGERFERAMKEIAAACASRKLARGEVCGEVTRLKPADPLATPEGRFAHSIKIPNPVPEDSGYKTGMTPQEYFDHLCKTEAGEFIYRTVENVEGIYQMRPRDLATGNKYQEHLYALEDPYGYTDGEAMAPEFTYVAPIGYLYFETSVQFEQKPVRGKQFRDQSIDIKPDASALYVRFYGYDGHKEVTMKKEYATTRKSRFGHTWRGISRPHDRELGIAGGELILLDLETNEVLAAKRGFIRSGGVRNLTGIWWPKGQICRNDPDRMKIFPAYEFMKKVLKPKNVSSEGGNHATK